MARIHRLGKYVPHCGDHVFDKADPRHVGRVDAVVWGHTVVVRFLETGWRGEIKLENARPEQERLAHETGIGQIAGMTADRYRQLLAALNLSHNEVADRFGFDARTSRRFAAGGKDIPNNIAERLETLAAQSARDLKGDA